mgnify:CR=1 FL=1
MQEDNAVAFFRVDPTVRSVTFSLADYVEVDTDSASPASIVDRVLQRLRAAYQRSLSRSDLAADPLCGGSVTAIRKALQRLVSRGLTSHGISGWKWL